MRRWAWFWIIIGIGVSFLILFFLWWKLDYYELEIENPMEAIEGDSGEIKLPPYSCEPWASYRFKLKKADSFLALFPSSVFDVASSELIFWEEVNYYAYPLSRLDIDLNVEEIIVKDWVFRHQDFVIAGDRSQEACWFSPYQAKDRNQRQILDFLLALSSGDFVIAGEFLKKNQKLIPFVWVLEACDFADWKQDSWKLVSSSVCERGGGPEILKYSLWIERGALYLMIQLDEEPDLDLRLVLEEKIAAFSGNLE